MNATLQAKILVYRDRLRQGRRRSLQVPMRELHDGVAPRFSDENCITSLWVLHVRRRADENVALRKVFRNGSKRTPQGDEAVTERTRVLVAWTTTARLRGNAT
jgi:hypothetical protein